MHTHRTYVTVYTDDTIIYRNSCQAYAAYEGFYGNLKAANTYGKPTEVWN